jgi:hypothetical protein
MAAKSKHKKPGRWRISACVVEAEYGATDDAADRPPRAHESVSNALEVPGILTESQRRERGVEILAEAVYGYLKRRGQLAARVGHMAGNTPEAGPGPEGRILDERLDFQAQPTGTCDCFENG